MQAARNSFVERRVSESSKATERHAGAEVAFEHSAFLLLGTTLVLTLAAGFSPAPFWLGLFVGAFAVALFVFGALAVRRYYWEKRTERLAKSDRSAGAAESMELDQPAKAVGEKESRILAFPSPRRNRTARRSAANSASFGARPWSWLMSRFAASGNSSR